LEKKYKGGKDPCLGFKGLNYDICQRGRESKRSPIVTELVSLTTFPTLATDTSAISGPTYYSQAQQGNLYTIGKLLTPTHFGVRFQGEFSASFGPWSPAATIGANFVHNFVSNENDSNVDFTIEPYAGGIGWGGSVTGGTLIGWGSSRVKDVTSGKSEVFGGTLAGGPAISISAVAPLNNDGNRLHVDQVYGIVPTTLYIGGGAGVGYAGAGAGKSTTIIP
jgi:hypothetical protein